jgi:ATP-dependent Clp protease ATP-binding subunit ClpA
MKALTAEQLQQATQFFEDRLIGQPEVVNALTDVLYKQNALLKRVLEQKGGQIPTDPTVLLLMGGSWGKSLAARLIPIALERWGHGSLTTLTPLPQDPEGILDFDPRAIAAPFATVVIENIGRAQHINGRFVNNLAHLIEAGMIGIMDQEQQTVHPVPLGLTTFIMTSSVADEAIRETLDPGSKLGFLQPTNNQPVDVDAIYVEVKDICTQALSLLPGELLRHVDETIILRPLSENDLKKIFDLEISHYQQTLFPGRVLTITFQDQAKEHLFAEAEESLEIYGSHALRRVLQHHIDPVVYRAYNKGSLTEENLDQQSVLVQVREDKVDVQLVPAKT